MKIKGIPVGTTTPRPDWEQKNQKGADFVKNKPSIKSGDGYDSIVQVASDNDENTQKPQSTATADAAVSLGRYNKVSGKNAMAVNYNNTVGGTNSFAANQSNEIAEAAENSFASGFQNKILAKFGHVGGWLNRVTRDFQTVFGYQNKETDALFAIGNGKSDEKRSNAFEVFEDGTVAISEERFSKERLLQTERMANAIAPDVKTFAGASVSIPYCFPGPVKDLKVHINAKQGGEGTPSAENVRPIVPFNGTKFSDPPEDTKVTVFVGNGDMYRSGTLDESWCYGGYVDWTRGVFVQTHEYIELDEKITIGYIRKNASTAGSYYISGIIDSKKKSQTSTGALQSTGMCNSMSYGNFDNVGHTGYCSGTNVWFKGFTECATIEEFHTYITEHPAHIVYPLETPIEHPLEGNEEIWLTEAPCYIASDGSNLEVEPMYVSDIPEYIDQKFTESKANTEATAKLYTDQKISELFTEDSSYPGCYYRMVDGKKEWFNPPMMVGVEYRTTRRDGGCVVYAKSLDVGQLAEKGGTKAAIYCSKGATRLTEYNAYVINTSSTNQSPLPLINLDGVIRTTVTASIYSIIFKSVEDSTGYDAIAEAYYTKD